MRNRAKCKLCGDILESFYLNDVVECSCGEITIWGGLYELNSKANDYENFLRIDEDGNEITVRFLQKGEEDKEEELYEIKGRLSKKEAIELMERTLKGMQDSLDHSMNRYVNYYDFCYYLSLILSALRED